MAKLTIQDLADVLVEKNDLSKQTAKAFVTAIFDIVQMGIRRDRLVKIKGLGTFKVVDVDARESVNVNTGERVLIDGHSKISFTPDATMKELVNKPFSGFETVVLNEGVEFDDMQPVDTGDELQLVSQPSEKMEEAIVTEEESTSQEEVSKAQDEALETTQEETVVLEKEAVASEQEVVVPQTSPVVSQEEVATPPEEEPRVESVNVNNTIPTGGSSWWKWLLVIVVCLLVGFACGFYCGMYYNSCGISETDEQKLTEDIENLLVTDTLKDDSLKTDSLQTDSVKAEYQQTDSLKTETLKADNHTTVESVPDYVKYDNMDQRVRTGAYIIIGTDQVVQAREGDNIARVSRRYLGEGMSCYVEVYNGCTASTPLKAGQEVKIPKLKLRKSVKK